MGAWVFVALLLALPALVFSAVFTGISDPSAMSFNAIAATPLASALMWQRELAWLQPWRDISAVWIHFSALHLAMNLLGTLCVVALGLAAGVPRRAAWAWLLAWPLTQMALYFDARIHGYGGLSGVLHAGVAVVAMHLLLGARSAASSGRLVEPDEPTEPPAPRWLGGVLLLGLALKIAHEAPWAHAVQNVVQLDIPVVPLAHALGALSGALCMALLARWRLA